MSTPSSTPAAAPMAKPAARRSSVDSAWRARMPLSVSRTNVATILSTPGKSCGGIGPYIANSCHAIATTTNGSATSAPERRLRRSQTVAGTRNTRLPARHRLLQEIPVQGLRDVRNALEPPFAGTRREVLRLIDEILLDLARDLRLPLDPAQRLVDHGDRDVAPDRFLLLGVDRRGLFRLLLQELHGAQPAAQVGHDGVRLLLDGLVGDGEHERHGVVLAEVLDGANDPRLLADRDVRLAEQRHVDGLGDQARDLILGVRDVGHLEVAVFQPKRWRDTRQEDVLGDGALG